MIYSVPGLCMSVQCPADPCDFTGMIDQVEGHIGGKADKVHEGVTTSSLQESLHGEGSDGLPVWVLGGLSLLVVLVVWYHFRTKNRENGPSESPEQEESGSGEVDSLQVGELTA